MIDKGQNSSMVLDLIIELQQNDYQIFPIRGNHEEKFLAAYSYGFDFFEKYLEEYNSLDLLEGELENYLKLIHNLEYGIELDQFFLSHSGINNGVISPFTDLRGMFPKINFQFDEELLFAKTQIHGHSVRTIVDIKMSIKKQEKRISIDSGCYLNEEGLGFLTALNLDNMKLYFQKRADYDIR